MTNIHYAHTLSLPKGPIAAFCIDPFESLNRESDTSLLLAKEACRREQVTFAFEPKNLFTINNQVYAKGRFFNIQADNSLHVSTQITTVCLNEVKWVFIRQDPPYDMQYITVLDMLMQLPKTTHVYNCPRSLLLYKEKTIPLQFVHLIPKTCITSQQDVILDFINTHGRAVLKPLHGCGGDNVILIQAKDTNTKVLVQMWCTHYPQGIIVQEFLPNVSHNERRLIFINGELKAVFKRIPEEGQIRSNTAIGGTAHSCDITAADTHIASHMGPFLKDNLFMLAGVDAIDDKLIEVNVTSPTGFVYANKLYGTSLEVDFWNAITNCY